MLQVVLLAARGFLVNLIFNKHTRMHTNPSSPHILKRCHSLPAGRGEGKWQQQWWRTHFSMRKIIFVRGAGMSCRCRRSSNGSGVACRRGAGDLILCSPHRFLRPRLLLPDRFLLMERSFCAATPRSLRIAARPA